MKHYWLLAPAAAVFAAFWLLPIARLTLVGASGPDGIATYAAVLTHPRYFRSLVSTLLLSGAVTVEQLTENLRATAVNGADLADATAPLVEPPAQYWAERARLLWN